MIENRLHPERKVSAIFLPSDFSEGSEIAFIHALKLALASKALLTVLHVQPNSTANWEDFPGVRETLERWKLIPDGSPKSAVAKLDIEVRKVIANNSDPVKECINYLQVNDADLIVLAVHPREGIMRWLGKSVGEPIVRDAKQMTLFLPNGVNGFVSREDGSVTLRNILIPIAETPDPQPAVEAVMRLIENLELSAGTVTLLRVNPPVDAKPVVIPDDSGWTWNELVLDGDPAHMILKAADQLSADLIVMTTDGPDGFLDGLRGTTSERVLSRAKCPVGNLPVDSLLG
ncbi:MAG: universal stress protein [Pirellula sp.]|jgi:nucleotide-binding universal stress UspA family protein